MDITVISRSNKWFNQSDWTIRRHRHGRAHSETHWSYEEDTERTTGIITQSADLAKNYWFLYQVTFKN